MACSVLWAVCVDHGVNGGSVMVCVKEVMCPKTGVYGHLSEGVTDMLWLGNRMSTMFWENDGHVHPGSGQEVTLVPMGQPIPSICASAFSLLHGALAALGRFWLAAA